MGRKGNKLKEKGYEKGFSSKANTLSNSERQERPKGTLTEDSAHKWRKGAEWAAGPTGDGKALMEGQRNRGKGCYHHT